MRTLIAVIGALGIVGCGPGPRGETPIDAETGNGQDTNFNRFDAAIDAAPDAPPDAGPVKLLVYAHTASELFSVDPDTLAITSVGLFQWPVAIGTDSMTDIAIDKTGMMVGISFSNVYEVDPATAVVTLLSTGTLGGTFNGLSFVPATMLGLTGDDILIATRGSDGLVFQVDTGTGATTQVGNMAGAYSSSGDLVAVAGLGVVQTVPGGSSDVLVSLASGTFAATPIGTTIGFVNIWGIAHGPTQIFGFTADGEFITIDPTTGVGTLVSTSANQWWGAAVNTTSQIVIQ